MAKNEVKSEAKNESKEKAPVGPPTAPAPVFKYATREDKFTKSGKVAFALSNATLLPGPNVPKSLTSVMGKIRALTDAQGKDGVSGDKLVALMRTSADFRTNRTQYGNGIPCVSWCQDYIIGAASKRKGFLRVKEGTLMKPEKAKEDQKASATEPAQVPAQTKDSTSQTGNKVGTQAAA